MPVEDVALPNEDVEEPVGDVGEFLKWQKCSVFI
jgi:hypothetical protein